MHQADAWRALAAICAARAVIPQYGRADIAPPVAEWLPHFQVRTLAAYEPWMRGTFRYAAPFAGL